LARDRLRWRSGAPLSPLPNVAAGAPQRDLGALLAPPRWLRNLGRSSWLVAGIALVTVPTVGLLALTQSIVLPVIAAAVIAAVASTIVAWLKRLIQATLDTDTLPPTGHDRLLDPQEQKASHAMSACVIDGSPRTTRLAPGSSAASSICGTRPPSTSATSTTQTAPEAAFPPVKRDERNADSHCIQEVGGSSPLAPSPPFPRL
jgi:uncharacterized protein with PQ loop repeat